jgi:VIT1/CCC1 family predicted Fe2+/Mn2+ transporter
MKEENKKSKSLLSPIERVSEILFGLIMALSFTCTINIVEADRAEVRDTLVAAIGCNIAWGLVDAIMYILSVLTERGRNKTILHFVRTTQHKELAKEYIADALPPVIASVTDNDQLEKIRNALLSVPESMMKTSLTAKDLKTALGIFLLVFISTFPVTIPFLLIKESQLALRISNLVAIVLMFICGWLLAGYGGYNKIVTSLTLTLIGIGLVALTISLGG